MTLALAPMEGLVDHHMRELLTRDSAFDFCVTEFLRVTDQLLAERAFRRICPESFNQWKTPSGTPVHLQLLGNNVSAMTDNACRGAVLGAPVIDVNFGCPMFGMDQNGQRAKRRRNTRLKATTYKHIKDEHINNKHSRYIDCPVRLRNGQKNRLLKRKKDTTNVNTCGESYGGSILLQYPDEIFNLLSTMRKALPEHVPLTAKMRLGYEDKTLAIENAQAIEEAGVSQLCIHARTKTEGYKPPAHWHYIARIKEHVNLPILANGEIWNLDDYKLAKQESNCEHIMLGRGAVAMPDLAIQVQRFENNEEHDVDDWNQRLKDMLWMMDSISKANHDTATQGKIKQWLAFLKFRYTEAQPFFQSIKKLKTPEDIAKTIRQHII